MRQDEIKRLRQSLCWSQQRMAEKLGVCIATVVRWERGRSVPSPLALEKLERLARRAAAK